MKLSSISALALACAATEVSAGFEGISIRSGSPIHLHPLTAHDNKIWLGGKTNSFCPQSVEPNCPPGRVTGFVSVGKSLYMSAEVPGGQQVYVGPDGRLSYTAAHSSIIPDGSETKPFGYVPGPPGRSGNLKFKGKRNEWAACKEGDKYAVYAPGFRPDCTTFAFGTEKVKKVTAWQYD